MIAVQSKLLKLRTNVISLVDQHRLAVGIALVVAIVLILTFLNMWLYVQSGAAGLDLSRPGYSEVRDSVRVSNNDLDFSAEGILSVDIIDEYLVSYRDEARLAEQLGAFNSEPLSDEVLRLKIAPVDQED